MNRPRRRTNQPRLVYLFGRAVVKATLVLDCLLALLAMAGLTLLWHGLPRLPVAILAVYSLVKLVVAWRLVRREWLGFQAQRSSASRQTQRVRVQAPQPVSPPTPVDVAFAAAMRHLHNRYVVDSPDTSDVSEGEWRVVGEDDGY